MKVRVLFSYVFWDYVIVCSFYHKMDNDTSSYFDQVQDMKVHQN